MRNETREALQLFVEKANKLKSLSFAESVRELKFKWSWTRGESARFEIIGPNREQIDAFILTFRFFIQDNEHTLSRRFATDQWREVEKPTMQMAG